MGLRTSIGGILSTAISMIAFKILPVDGALVVMAVLVAIMIGDSIYQGIKKRKNK